MRGRPFDLRDFEDFSAMGHWIAGFLDGEGCFLIRQASRNARERAGRLSHERRWFCVMQIGLRVDDYDVLALMQKYIGGHLVRMKARRAAVLTLSSKEECENLVALLDAYPMRAKKRRDYEVWREAVLYWTSREHGQKCVNFEPMVKLRDKLVAGRAYAG